MTDVVGHGTFVSGLIAAVDGNGIGGKGVAGNTRCWRSARRATAASRSRTWSAAIEAAVRRGRATCST